MEEFLSTVIGVLGAIAILIAATFLVPLALMVLWNYAMTAAFGLPTIGYWQSMALIGIATILFRPVNYPLRKG